MQESLFFLYQLVEFSYLHHASLVDSRDGSLLVLCYLLLFFRVVGFRLVFHLILYLIFHVFLCCGDSCLLDFLLVFVDGVKLSEQHSVFLPGLFVLLVSIECEGADERQQDERSNTENEISLGVGTFLCQCNLLVVRLVDGSKAETLV